jgi:hypothetical protein
MPFSESRDILERHAYKVRHLTNRANERIDRVPESARIVLLHQRFMYLLISACLAPVPDGPIIVDSSPHSSKEIRRCPFFA